MKSISSALASHFGKNCTTLAVLWKVKRQDGTVFGFTTHDQDIVYPGVTGHPVNNNAYFGRYVGGTTHGVIIGDITTQNGGFAGDLALISLTDGSQIAFTPALLNPTNFYSGTFDIPMSCFRDNKTFAPTNTNLAIPADVPLGTTVPIAQEGGVVSIINPNTLSVVGNYNLTDIAATTVTTQGSMYTYRGAWSALTVYAVGDIVTSSEGVKCLALTTSGPSDPMGVGVVNPATAGNPTYIQRTAWAGVPSFKQHVGSATQSPCYTPLANIAYNQSLNTIVSTQEFVGGPLMLHTLGGTPQSYILQDRTKALVLSIDLQKTFGKQGVDNVVTATGNSSATSVTATPSFANEWALAIVNPDFNTDATVSSGWTALFSGSGTDTQRVAYKTLTGTSPVTFSETYNAPDGGPFAWSSVLALFSGTPTIRQSASPASGASASFASNTTAGSTILAIVSGSNAPPYGVFLSDTQGLTFQQVAYVSNGTGSSYCGLYLATGAAAAAETVTGNTIGGGAIGQVSLIEVAPFAISPVANGTLTFKSSLDNSTLATISVTNPASETVLTVAAFVDQNLVDASGNGVWFNQSVNATYSVGGVHVDTFAQVDSLFDSFGGLAGQWGIYPDIDGHSVWVVSYVYDMQAIQKYDLNTKTLTKSWFWPFAGSNGFSSMFGFEDGTAFFFQDSVGNIYAWSQSPSNGTPCRLHKIDPSTFTEIAALGFDREHPAPGYPAANSIFLHGNFSDWALYQSGGKDYLAYNGGTPSAGGQFVGVINLTDMTLVGTCDEQTVASGQNESHAVWVDKNGDVWWLCGNYTDINAHLLKWHPADGTSGTGTDGNPKLVLHEIFSVDGTLFQGNSSGGGTTYLAGSGMVNTAKASKSDLSVDNLEVTAFLDSTSINEHDMRAGLYDYATVEVRVVNWANLGMGDMKVLSGTVGEVKMKNGAFKSEVRGLTQYLTTQVVQKYGPLCRAEWASGPESGIDTNNRYLCHLRNTDYQQSGSVNTSPDAFTIIPNAGLNAISGVGGGSPTVSVVQHVSNFNASGANTLQLIFPGAISSGNTIFLTFDAFDFTAGSPSITITDNHGQTYTQVNHANNGEHDSFTYYKSNAAAGSTTINISITDRHSNSFIVGGAAELSGLLTPVVVDGSGTNSAGSATGTFLTGAITTTNPDDVILTAIYSPDAAAPNGYTVIDRATFTNAQGGFGGVGNIGWSFAYVQATDVGSFNPAWQTSVLHGIFGNTVAFKLAPVTPPPASSTWFNDGLVIWTSGPMNGFKTEIKNWDGTALTTFLPMPYQPLHNDTFIIEPGCNKTITDCEFKFKNIKNFRGEPFIPGNDLILLYPDSRT
jgi:hypothetical protein